MMTLDSGEAIGRSYSVQRSYRVGSKVSVNQILNRRIPVDTSGPDWVWEDVKLVPGDTFKIISYTNAGFNGIEASVELSDGRVVGGVSAGYFIPPFSEEN